MENKINKILYQVLRDMESYNDNAVLIGGWLPYIYSNYLWKLTGPAQIIATQDIDFALKEDFNFKGQVLSEMFASKENYVKERIYEEDEKPFCLVIKDGSDEMRLDFISHEYMDPKLIGKITGGDIEVAPIGYVELMIKKENTMLLDIADAIGSVRVRVPLPAVYAYVKGLSCGEREMKERGYKFKKDLWAIYYVIDNIPTEQRPEFIQKILEFKDKDKEYFRYFIENLSTYFASPESEGPSGVFELLNLPEEFIKKQVYNTLKDFLNSIR